MSKQQRKHAHNPRNPNTCRRCLINPIGKTRLAYGHTICQACARTDPHPTAGRYEKCGETGCSYCDNNEEMPNE